MKKMLILFALALCMPAAAEVVSTVSFNPARMGEYNFLKISKDASFKGGLETPTLNVNPGGTVKMDWDSPVTSEKYYNVPNTISGGADTAVDMSQTTFLKEDPLTSSSITYNAANSSVSAGLVDSITINGGSLNFKSSKDSYVKSVNGDTSAASSPLEFYTKNLTEDSTLNVTGNAGNSIYLTNSDGAWGFGQTLGFHLAGVDIPHPDKHSISKQSSTDVKENFSLDLTKCKLSWVKRTAEEKADGKTTKKDVYVLGYDECDGFEAPVEEETVTCFTRINWSTNMRNIEYINLWDAEYFESTGAEWMPPGWDPSWPRENWTLDKYWLSAISHPNWDEKWGKTGADGFSTESYWQNVINECTRCSYAQQCECTPGKEYALTYADTKVYHVPSKRFASQLIGWHTGVCERTTPDKCLSWNPSELGLSNGALAWKKGSGVIDARTAGGGTVKHIEEWHRENSCMTCTSNARDEKKDYSQYRPPEGYTPEGHGNIDYMRTCNLFTE